jgi:Phage portal protein, SPP1 Gp6-like
MGYSDDLRLFPALPNQGQSISSDDRDWIIREVQGGLRNHRPRLAAAIENQAFYDLESDRYQPRREAETEFDFAGRPRRTSGFVQQAVDRLCEHTYCPGPQRTVVDDEDAQELLEQVWETVHIDALMHHAEAQATLNNVCAIQVKASNDQDHPIDLQLWGGDEFTVFTDPEDPRKATAVVTIDRYNERTRYRLWFDDEVQTFLTDQYSSDKTAGARVAYPTKNGREKNTYGCLPFAFLHYRAPVRQFWTPGPGTFLRKAELRINDRLSELDELILKYARPIGVFKNVSVAFTPEVGPGRFMRLNRGGTGFSGDGFADGGEPSVEYLQASLAIESIWVDLEKYMKQVATAVNLPFVALEIEYGDAPSGISLIIKEWPLLNRAKNRRRIYQMAETSLARTMLTCYGNHYGQTALATSAPNLELVLAWAEPSIPVPGPDRDQLDQWSLEHGLKSRVSVCMERFGLTRQAAIEHIKQMADDEQEVTQLLPQAEQPEEFPGVKKEPQEDDTQGASGEAEEQTTNGPINITKVSD